MPEILFEDNHILVCIKPKGVLSQSDGSGKPDMLTMLKQYIKEKYNKPGNVYLGLVHRLDMNTSGVMVFAKTSKAASRLTEAIQKHDFEKRYIATVEGNLEGNNVPLKNYLVKDEKQKKSFLLPTGDEARLVYTSIRHYDIGGTPVTDVDIRLETGRFHQIRCQMAGLGHPLYGDVKYGSRNHVPEEKFPLRAYRLSFPHPITHERMTFTMED